jgi:choline kinase
MDAILYAAGVAHRMGPEYRDDPKILLEVGGRSLLEWHAGHLASLGCGNVHVVTGHRREKLWEALVDLGRRYPVTFHEIVNPDYREGSVLSFHASLPVLRRMPDEILLMDGDVLYHREILWRLLDSRYATALLVDYEYSTLDDDPVLVPIRAGRPFEMVKRWQGEADRVGESIGFFKVHRNDIPLLIEETRSRVEDGRRSESYDEVLRALVRAGRFNVVDVTDLPWTEIDFPYDLAFAREKVLPGILQTK